MRERLVIGEDGKPPAFEHMAEMPDAGETGPQFSVESGITCLSRL
jgi:hypothetical protein